MVNCLSDRALAFQALRPLLHLYLLYAGDQKEQAILGRIPFNALLEATGVVYEVEPSGIPIFVRQDYCTPA